MERLDDRCWSVRLGRKLRDKNRSANRGFGACFRARLIWADYKVVVVSARFLLGIDEWTSHLGTVEG